MAVLNRITFVEDCLIKIAWVIKHVLPQVTVFPQTSYEQTLIWIVLEGERKIEVGGAHYQVKAGEIVVIPPQTPRTVLAGAPGDEPFHFYTIGCDLKIGPLNFTELYKFPLVTQVKDAAAFKAVTTLTEKLLEQSLQVIKALNAINQPQKIIPKISTDETAALIEIGALFHVWFARFLVMMRDYLPSEPQEIDPRIQKLCTYMQQNFKQKLTLHDLSQHVFMSESHLRLLFRKAMGVSPTAYLRKLRLQYAKDLLINTTFTLSEIAERSGFETLNHFSRMFSKYESIPATQYRKQYNGTLQG